MDSYTSLGYVFGFLPLALVAYQLTPKNYRWITLLLIDYFFFFILSRTLLIYLLVSTLVTYLFGKKLDDLKNERKKVIKESDPSKKKEIKKQYQKKESHVVTLSVIFHIGMIFVLKYTPFVLKNVDSLFNLNIPILRFMIPIGLSFYTLEAVSYLFDIYRDKYQFDPNFGRLALFLSYFPLLMEGPISRYNEVAYQIYEGNDITYQNATFGYQRILFGLMKKVVVADRLNTFIIEIYRNYASYNGSIIFLGAVFYTIQLYMEFSGSMDVVIGSAEIMGVTLPENFRQPFFSKTISEFWQRWHISLGTWFKDYLFYPLSMSKPLKKLTTKARKRLGNHYGPLIAGSIALFAVWFSNGLWHGAAWSYVFFGLYHFFFILMGNIFEPTSRKLVEAFKINREAKWFKTFQIIRTTLIVFIGEMFFRGHGLRNGLGMFKCMVTNFSLKPVFDGTLLTMGLDLHDLFIIFAVVLVVFIVGLIKEKGHSPRELIAAKPTVVRYAFYYALIFGIIIFGAYGIGYVPLDPIYANF